MQTAGGLCTMRHAGIASMCSCIKQHALSAVAMFCRANKQGAGSKRGMAQQAHSKKRSRHAAGQSSGYNGYDAAWGYAPDLMCGVEGPAGYGAGAPAGGAFKVGKAECETPSCLQFRCHSSEGEAIPCRRARQSAAARSASLAVLWLSS